MFNKTFFVSEIGNNHEGDFNTAKELILKAKKAGVDAVKLQFINPVKLIHISEKKRISFLKKVCLSFDEIKKLKFYAKKLKLIFFCSIFDTDSIQKLSKIQNIFKVSSSDNNYIDLIQKIASYRKKVLISTGMTDFKNLKKIENIFLNQLENLCFLHCVSKYPTDKMEAQLDKIDYLKKEFPKISIGYSDHTIGIEAPVIAAAKKIDVIEKHFTLDHNFSDFRDHKLSANPEELQKMVLKIREVEKYCNIKKNPVDKNNLLRRGIYFKKNLKKNKKIKKDDLFFVRPKKIFGLEDLDRILGKKTSSDKKKNDIVKKISNEKIF